MAKNPKSKNSGDYFKTRVHFKDVVSARAFIQAYDFSSVCAHGHARPQAKEPSRVELEFILNKAEISTIKKLDLEYEVMENISAITRERQKEVGKGDRFKGGKIPPKSKNLSVRNAKRGDQECPI